MMLRPQDSHDQRLISATLTCEPAAQLSWSHDVFGNSIATATFTREGAVLSVKSELVIGQYAPDWPVFAIDYFALNFPFAYSADERVDLGALLTPQYADPSGQLKRWARGFVRGKQTDTLSLLKDLNSGVSTAILYQSRDDERTQGPLESLGRGWGTCRDYAVLFAEAARVLGFGARIASGYLFDPNEELTGVRGLGSTHAWTEIYLPGAGWISFDPTNGSVGGAHLIRVAVGRDIAQVSPIAGSFQGVPDDFLGMQVAVRVSAAADQSGVR
jgi:transglutaminase-like putative cysteine protease